MSADELTTALTNGQAWLVLSLAAVLPILWAFTLINALRAALYPAVPADPDPALRRRRLVALLRAVPRRPARHHARP